MKPISVEFQAFGSYPGLVKVDFTALESRGLFVVSGDTGTGKTTIFDAMTYALYGKMPLKESADIRSHTADEDDETFARLTFEINKQRYVAERKPAQERAAKSGTRRVAAGPAATLTRLTNQATEPVATNARATTTECTRLIGLTAEQFQRVILLPQGDFSQFLLSNSTDREELLAQLFDGKIFQDVIDELKRRSKASAKEVQSADGQIAVQLGQADQQIQRLFEQLELPRNSSGLSESPQGEAAADSEQSGPDRSQLGSELAAAAEPLKARQAESAVAAAAATKATEAASKLADQAKRYKMAAVHTARLEELADQQEEVDRNENASKASQQARPVVVAAKESAEAAELVAKAKKDRVQRLLPVQSALGALGVAEAGDSAAQIAAAVTACRDKVEAKSAKVKALRSAQAAVQASQSMQADLKARELAAQDRIAQSDTLLAELAAEKLSLEESAVDMTALSAQLEAAEKKARKREELEGLQADRLQLGKAEKEARDSHLLVFSQFVAAQAPLLAEQLNPGEPCSVCGSAEHPKPAQMSKGETATAEDLDTATLVRDDAIEKSRACEQNIQDVTVFLGDEATQTADYFEKFLVGITQRHVAAKAAHEALQKLAVTQGSAQNTSVESRTDLAVLEEKVRAQETTVDEDQAVLNQAALAAESIDAEAVETQQGLVADLAELTLDLDTLFDSVTLAEGNEQHAKSEALRKLEESAFASLEEAVPLVLDESIEQAGFQAADDQRKELTGANAALKSLQEQGIPDQLPDLEAAELAKTAACERRDALAHLCTMAETAQGDADSALAEHDDLATASGALREQDDLIRHTAATCEHGGKKRMSLRRWVLARELDQVTNAANVHLRRMTSSRFSLERAEPPEGSKATTGLDLRVHDANTGSTRATTSLSGGEQFQASLSLALGLADVVSLGGAGSGKQFEALFVDEGFGSLDPNALEEAIAALHQLQSSGRMVGAITHVEAMKQQLHVGIEVTRLADGSGSTLVVHP
jgi:exonuclease SbcC